MVTISDVARDAGVSPSTVSYALSGKRSISTETRHRIEASIRRLGYHPHAGARALASSRTNVLALVVPLRMDLNVPVVMQFVGAAVTAARAYDHDLLLLTKDEGPEGVRRVSASAMADAVIVMDVEASEPRVPVLQSLGRPAVLIGVPDQPRDLSCVDLDFTAAGATAVHHLAELGHRDIALLGPSPAVYERGTSYAGRFLRGFTSAADRHRMAAHSYPCVPSYEGVRTCLDELFRTQPMATGLVVHNEAVLSALLAELSARRISVPQRLSIVAVCPDDMVENHGLALTSVAIPTAEVGQLAVEMAMRQLGGIGQPEIRLLSPRLTVRDSTAPAPADLPEPVNN
ncbi:MAG TPA: LacI family DNA-binding transcriptional regulator [Pseudonocardiaceae bacterium]|nr:LacI family DNA-binding transcriptional regulator [Pseudonocardiaceae bacterium]